MHRYGRDTLQNAYYPTKLCIDFRTVVYSHRRLGQSTLRHLTERGDVEKRAPQNDSHSHCNRYHCWAGIPFFGSAHSAGIGHFCGLLCYRRWAHTIDLVHKIYDDRQDDGSHQRRNGSCRSHRHSIQFPLYMVLISFTLNMLITWAILLSSNQIVRFVGKGGLKAVSRVFSLLLAAIAVNMIIHGLELAGLSLSNTM